MLQGFQFFVLLLAQTHRSKPADPVRKNIIDDALADYARMTRKAFV